MSTIARLSSSYCSCSLHIRAYSYYFSHQTSSSTSALFGHQRFAYHYYFKHYAKELQYSNTERRNFVVCNNVQPEDGQLPSQPRSTFLNWIVGVVLAIILPFVTNNKRPGALLLKLKNEVGSTVEAIEEMAETVEKVAEAVDKAIDEIADELPKEGKLREVIHIVEDVAEKTAKNAHIVGDVIDTEIEEKVSKSVAKSLREQANSKNSQESTKG